MNNSYSNNSICLEYTCFNHIDELTNEFIDVGNTIILPLINVFSLITNAISIIVYSSKKLNNGINHYLLLISISDFVFSLASIPVPFIRCGAFCSFSYSYWAKAIELYIYIFIVNSCLLFSLIIDIEMAIKKLLSLSTKLKKFKDFKIRENKLRVIIIFLVSIFANVPVYPLSREVHILGYLASNRNDITTYEILYTIASNSIGNIHIFDWVIFGLTLLKGPVLICFLLAINFMVFINFRRYMKKRNKTFGTLNSAGIIKIKIILYLKIFELLKRIYILDHNHSDNEHHLSNRELRTILMSICISLFYVIGKGPGSLKPIFFIYEAENKPYNSFLLITK